MRELPDLGRGFGEQNLFLTENRDIRWCLELWIPESFRKTLSHSFCTLFMLLTILVVGTAQILQVLKHCPCRCGGISAVFPGKTEV